MSGNTSRDSISKPASIYLLFLRPRVYTMNQEVSVVVLRTWLVISLLVGSSLFQQNYVRAQSTHAPPAQPPQTAATPKSDENELNTILMQATFKLQSVTVPGQPLTLGVVFIMGRPILNPPPDQPNSARFVLITAAHVLDEIPGEFGILNLRRKNNQGDWERLLTPIQIR